MIQTLDHFDLGITVHQRATQRRFVAWLAMAALWLAVVAPVVSRTLAGAGATDMDSWCDMHHTSGVPASGLPHGHPLQKCGYCGLLACHPLLPGMAPSPPAPLPLVELPPRVPVMSAQHAGRPLATAPRGPPRPRHA